MDEGKYKYDGWRIIRVQHKGSSVCLYRLVKLDLCYYNKLVYTLSCLDGLTYEDYGIIDYYDGLIGEDVIKQFDRDDKLKKILN